MTEINLEEVQKLLEFRRKVNSCKLEELVCLDNGKRVYIDPEDIREWNMIGLSNLDFIAHHLLTDKSFGLKITTLHCI